MSLNRLTERLREMQTIRRNTTPLSVAIGLAQEAADELDRLQARVAELEALMLRIEPHIDSIICYASTMGEHEPNRIAHDLRAAIDTARKAKP